MELEFTIEDDAPSSLRSMAAAVLIGTLVRAESLGSSSAAAPVQILQILDRDTRPFRDDLQVKRAGDCDGL